MCFGERTGNLPQRKKKKGWYEAFALSISYHLILPQAVKEHILDMLSRLCRVELLLTELTPSQGQTGPSWDTSSKRLSCVYGHPAASKEDQVENGWGKS